MKIESHKIELDNFGEKHAFKIFAQGDQHTDDLGHIPRSFSLFMDAVKASSKNSFAILTGDPFTFANTRSQKAMRAGFLQAPGGDEAALAIDAMVMEQNGRPFKRSIEPIKEKFKGWVEGNHGWMCQDGTTIDERIAEMLGIPYSDGLLILCLTLNVKGRKGMTRLNIVAHHGVTGAKTIGGDIQNMVRYSSDNWCNAHVLIEGHTHGLSVTPFDKISISDQHPLHLNHHVFWVARSGGAVKSYRVGRAGYAEKRLMNTTTPGHIEFKVWLVRSEADKLDKQYIHIEGQAKPLHGRTLNGP